MKEKYYINQLLEQEKKKVGYGAGLVLGLRLSMLFLTAVLSQLLVWLFGCLFLMCSVLFGFGNTTGGLQRYKLT